MKEKKTWVLIVMSVLFMAVICSAACYYESYIVRTFPDVISCRLITMGSADEEVWTFKEETGCRPKEGLKKDCTVSVRNPDGTMRVQELRYKKYSVNYCGDDYFAIINEVKQTIFPFGLARTGNCME